MTRFFTAEELHNNTDPLLAPLLANAPETDRILSTLPVEFEEPTAPNGDRYLCATMEGMPLLAIRFPDNDGPPQTFDYLKLYDALDLTQPSPILFALGMAPQNNFGDDRDINERAGLAVDFSPIDHPDGNRFVVLIHIVAHGLLTSSEYKGALLGWQAYTEPLDQDESGVLPADLGDLSALLNSLSGLLPPDNGGNRGGGNPFGGMF